MNILGDQIVKIHRTCCQRRRVVRRVWVRAQRPGAHDAQPGGAGRAAQVLPRRPRLRRLRLLPHHRPAIRHLHLHQVRTTDPIARGFCRRGKLEVAGNEGHEQARKADHTVIPL